MTDPVKTDELLAKAGRAGVEQCLFPGDTVLLWSDGDLARLTRAVLDTLQIEWDGSWEWRRVWPSGEVWEAPEGLIRHPNDGEVQCRPKLTVRWSDAE